MKYLYLLMLLLIPQIAMPYSAAVPWFTDATITDSIKGAKPANALPSATGTYANGVQLTQELGIDDPGLMQTYGAIGFWISPNWDGNDGQNHKLLRIGNPATEGLLIEKSAQNTIRYVMAGSGKVVAAHADVSGWKSGEWHHIYVSWSNGSNGPLGLPLWIDKVCVDGPIFTGTAFMNVNGMSDKKVYIGDTSSNAVMDELIFHYYSTSVANVYQDYFRTAPYTAMQVDPDPNRIPSDHRVVNGKSKQFGVKALAGTTWEPVTDFAVRYGNWADFDAKPYITWSSSNTNIATVNSNGKVTGKAVGSCTLTARFHGLVATYPISVISITQPDIDLMNVERTPKYASSGTKWWPAEGEAVQSVAHIGNFGYTTLPAGTVVKFELIPDTNGNFQVDAGELPTSTQTTTIAQSLAPLATTTVSFPWAWTQNPVFVRVTVDPNNTVSEICEANNQRCELNVARAFSWGYDPQLLSDNYNNKVINLLGSFSNYDWCDAMTDRVNQMLRDTKYPDVSPNGIADAVRMDNFQPVVNGDTALWSAQGVYTDGGFPNMEPQNSTPMDIDAAICHEIGHTTLALPDLYGYPVQVDNVYLKDPSGQLYSRTKILPEVSWGTTISSFGEGAVPCGEGYVPLMNYVHMWLLPEEAGTIQHFAQFRGEKFWGVQGDFVPTNENTLRVYDVNDQPLSGAAVYVYHVINTPLSDASSKYFVDRPKFLGNTNASGEWTFPMQTDIDWDDPNTDVMDGAINITNPFGMVDTPTAFTPNVWTTEGLFLIKIVSGTQTEFRMMTLTEFNDAYFRQGGSVGHYNIRTSLQPSGGTTPILRPSIPSAIRQYNRKPIVVVPSVITARKNQQFTIDASQSYDPEGQPLTFHWNRMSGYAYPDSGSSSIFTGTAPSDYTSTQYRVYVFDGLRMSEPVTVTVNVVSATTIAGKVTDTTGNPVVGAVVGVKASAYASADPIMYLTTDANGNYGPQFFQPGTYYVAAWKEGWEPTSDTVVTFKEDVATTVNLQLTTSAKITIPISSSNVAASNSASGLTPSRAVDGNLTTAWESIWWPTDPVYFYIDLGKSTDISGFTLYRYIENTSSVDDYTIDVMDGTVTDAGPAPAGSPLDPASWNNNPAVRSVYSATQTLHGSTIQTGLAADPIKMSLTGIRGIRFTFRNCNWPPIHDFREIKIHGTTWSSKISDVKKLSNGTVVQIINKQITGVPTGAMPTKTYYIEDLDRASGIRVSASTLTSVPAGLGDVVDVTGTVSATTSGEKYISATSIVRKSDVRPVSSVGMACSAANITANQGLAVKVWGKVKTSTSGYFTVSDGGPKTVKVLTGSLARPAVNQFVRVRGIISSDTTGPTLLLQKQVDWTLLTDTYQPLPIPGTAGSTRDYLLCGLFRDTTPGVNLMDIDFISRNTGGALTESTIRPMMGDSIGTADWFRYDGLSEVVDLNRVFGNITNCVAYAYVEIYSPIAQNVDMPLGSDDSIAVWVNGTQVYRQDALLNNSYGAVCARNVPLNVGLNSVLIKVNQSSGLFGFVAQFATTGTYTGPGWGKSTPTSNLGYVLGHE